MKPNCHHLCHHYFLTKFDHLSSCFYNRVFNFVTKVTREKVVFYFIYLPYAIGFSKK
jgi:hypothetical protein